MTDLTKIIKAITRLKALGIKHVNCSTEEFSFDVEFDSTSEVVPVTPEVETQWFPISQPIPDRNGLGIYDDPALYPDGIVPKFE